MRHLGLTLTLLVLTFAASAQTRTISSNGPDACKRAIQTGGYCLHTQHPKASASASTQASTQNTMVGTYFTQDLLNQAAMGAAFSNGMNWANPPTSKPQTSNPTQNTGTGSHGVNPSTTPVQGFHRSSGG